VSHVGHLPEISFQSFGKPKDIWRPILATYEKRLDKATAFKHVILREKGENSAAVKSNATKLLAPHCEGSVFTLVFDERGKCLTSVEFANLLASVRPRKLAAVVGTSYGLGDDFISNADRCVSLGPMTLPHEIARVTALEQIYRADTILSNHPYHHS